MELFNKNSIDFLKTLPSGSIGLVVTDPPYGIDYKDWDSSSESEAFTREWLTEVYRVLTPTGTCWTFGAPTQVPMLFKIFQQIGFHNNLKNWTIYSRAKGRGARKHLKSQREDIFHLTKSEKYVWHSIEYLRRVVVPYTVAGTPRGWALDIGTGERVRFTGVGNVMHVTSPSYNNKFETQIHPAQKPVILMAMLIMMSSRAGDTVLDPFMGSGSTGVAAVISDRDFIGIEKDEQIFNTARKRLASIDWVEAEKYIKKRVSTSEPGKFNEQIREILPKLPRSPKPAKE